MEAGLLMLKAGCSVEQVNEQMNWRPHTHAMSTLLRTYMKEQEADAKAQKQPAIYVPKGFAAMARAAGVDPTRARYVLTKREATIEELFRAIQNGTEKELPPRTTALVNQTPTRPKSQKERALEAGTTRNTVSYRAALDGVSWDVAFERMNNERANDSKSKDNDALR